MFNSKYQKEIIEEIRNLLTVVQAQQLTGYYDYPVGKAMARIESLVKKVYELEKIK